MVSHTWFLDGALLTGRETMVFDIYVMPICYDVDVPQSSVRDAKRLQVLGAGSSRRSVQAASYSL